MIDAYRLVKREFPAIQLALVGSMAHDDPEGWDYYKRTVEHADGDPDVHILSNMNNVGALEVNAFQVHSQATLQKSIREGFGLTVTEALWKARPTVAGRVGGIVAQITDRETGWLVDSPEQCAEACIEILRDPAAAREIALRGKEHVRRFFLTPRLLHDWLVLFNRLLGTGLETADPVRIPAGAGDPRRGLIVVSNRGPVSYGRDDEGQRIARRGAGGLATALRGLLGSRDVTWIASAMTDEDRLVAAEAGGAAVSQEAARRVAVPPAADRSRPPRLRRVLQRRSPIRCCGSRSTICGGSASEPDLGAELEPAWEEGYRAVNRAFAAAVVEELDLGAETATGPPAVFFHDYHLYLAPGIVRAVRPDALLAHFVHIPWPQSDYWRVLPKRLREAVHDGLLANDVVGFHTERWRRNFEECAVALAGAGALGDGRIAHAGRTMRTTSHPISVDVAEFDALSRQRAGARTRTRPRRPIGPSCSSCASIAPTRRRTSCAAFAPSACCSSAIPSCMGASGCSRCSTRRGRTFRRTPTIWRRSSARSPP